MLTYNGNAWTYLCCFLLVVLMIVVNAWLDAASASLALPAHVDYGWVKDKPGVCGCFVHLVIDT